MRIVVQRVLNASVSIENELYSFINQGLMILVGVEEGDTEHDMEWIAAKAVNMRIFDDDAGVMNRSVIDAGGEVLAVSQFTLTASTKKGNRPSYIRAAGHETAIRLYDGFCDRVGEMIVSKVQKGVFGADMQVALVNDGPVTIIVDSRIKE